MNFIGHTMINKIFVERIMIDKFKNFVKYYIARVGISVSIILKSIHFYQSIRSKSKK